MQEKQRAIQIRRNAELIGSVREVLVEGRHDALGQWIGRTSDNRTLNFTHPGGERHSLAGSICRCASRAPAPTPWWAKASNCGVMKLGRA